MSRDLPDAFLTPSRRRVLAGSPLRRRKLVPPKLQPRRDAHFPGGRNRSGLSIIDKMEGLPKKPEFAGAPGRGRWGVCILPHNRENAEGLMNPLPKALGTMARPMAMRALLAWERMESGVAYNPLSPALRADPYSFYEELRRKDPVHRMRLQDAWVLTDYADVDMVLRDNRRFGNGGRDFGYIPQVSMLDLDPPEHTKVRGLVSRGFTPRSVAALEPRIRETVEVLLGNVEGRGRFDLITEVAFPLPVIIIAEMLGVPPEDRERFNEWSNIVSLIVDPLLDDQQVHRVQQAVDEVFSYFEAVAEERRRDPKDDLVSALVTAEVDGERLEQGRPAGEPAAGAGGGERDHAQPHRQRRPGAAAQPRPVPEAAPTTLRC